jgi:hypothetical protein
MTTRTRLIRAAALLTAVSVSGAAWSQGFGGRGGGGPPVELSPERQVPAESLIDPNWEPPRMSWGDPVIQGHWTTNDMRNIPSARSAQYGEAESLSEEEFLSRAQSQERSRQSAEDREAFLRNEWGTMTFGFNSKIVEPTSGQKPAYNTEAHNALRAAAQQAGGSTFSYTNDFHRFTDFSNYDRCIALGTAGGWNPLIYGNGVIVAQSPNSVAITYEMIHETRVIPLDQRPHLPNELKQINGNARGYWEGDTLVIESMGFDPSFSVDGTTPSDQFRMTERIRRVHDDMLEYRVTFSDPVTLTEPYTMRLMWTTEPGYYVWEYGCHEGNGAVGHSLSGERAWEREVAAAVAAGTEPPGRGDVYGAPGADAAIYDVNTGELID